MLCRIGARDVRTAVIIKEKQMKSLKQKTLEYSKMYVNSNYWEKNGRQCEDKKKKKEHFVGRIIFRRRMTGI